ncbi:MAG: DUF5711 family protein [Candidatus Pelethousia sp.]|nr:DUF5711 family protein [Candidatus Pelethousia sp.]
MRKRRFVVRRKGTALFRVGLLLGAVLFLCGAAYGIFSLLRSGGQGMRAGQLSFTADTNYIFTGKGFLYMYGDRLYYEDLVDTKKNVSYQVSTGDVNLAASSTLSVLYHTSAVQIIGAGEPLTISGQVLDVACGTDHVAVLREDTSGTSLLIYDKTGTQTDQMDFAAGALVDFGFAQTGDETMWTLELSVTGALPISTLTTYNLATNHTTGVMTVLDQLVHRVVFTQNSIFLSCTTNLIRFNRTGITEAYRLLIYGWELRDVSTGGSGPLMLFSKRGAASNEGTVKLITLPEGDVASATQCNVQLPEGTISAFLAGGKLQVCTAEQLYSYSASGTLLATTELPRATDSVSKLSESYMLLTSGNGLYTAAVK